MSIDEAGSEKLIGGPAFVPEEPKKKGTRSRPAKVKKHHLTTAYKNEVAEKMDKLDAAGHTVVAITNSPDIRGFEIITYTEE
jgi:hypothetical protein